MKPIRAILAVTYCVLLTTACASGSDPDEMQSMGPGDDASVDDEFAENDESVDEADIDAESLALEQEPAELTAFASAIKQGRFGADPTALNVNGKLHVYSTSNGGRNIPHFLGTDPADIGSLGKPNEALPDGQRGKKLDGGIWAPTVRKAGGKYAMWYSGEVKGAGTKKCLWRAVADNPEGPFERFGNGEPICPDSHWNIDPYLYKAPGGFWLYSKVGGQLQRRRLNDNGLTFAAGSSWQNELNPSQPWERGDGQNGPVVENPGIVHLSKPNGQQRWILFYSANAWRTKHYGIGYADCGNDVGPGDCKKKSTKKGWMTSGVAGAPFGPGAASFFRYDKRDYMIIHGWENRCDDPKDNCRTWDEDRCEVKNNDCRFENKKGRSMYLFRVGLSSKGKPVAKAL